MQERRKAIAHQSTIKVPDKISPPIPFFSRPAQHRSTALYNIKQLPLETRSPWMNVMADIREHYLFAQSV